jgi:uncharacterized protein YbbK (DUF523 family)
MDAGVRKLQTATTGYKWQKETSSEKRDWTPKFVRGASKLFKDADAAVCVISVFFFRLYMECGHESMMSYNKSGYENMRPDVRG